jgi:hypothetical protein
MPDPILDLAADILRAGGPIAMTPAELATTLARLGAGPASCPPLQARSLLRRLAQDDRFILLRQGPRLLDQPGWTVMDRAAYVPVLEALDLTSPDLILLRGDVGASSGPESLEGTLRQTILRVAELPDGSGLVRAAEETRRALIRLTTLPHEAAPSTSLPPGPRPPG